MKMLYSLPIGNWITYTKWITKLSAYPRWIIGPSGPTGRPLPTAKQHEKNFTTRVFMLNIWRITVPLRNPISSGIPDPEALGRINWKINLKIGFVLKGYITRLDSNLLLKDR